MPDCRQFKDFDYLLDGCDFFFKVGMQQNYTCLLVLKKGTMKEHTITLIYVIGIIYKLQQNSNYLLS